MCLKTIKGEISSDINKSKVIELNNKNRIKFTVEKHRYEIPIKNGIREKNVALIILKDYETNKDIVHPFSEFIIKEFNGDEIKSQIDYARKITVFLNYILENKNMFRLNNFLELKYYHASKFINEYCADLQRNTAKGYKNILSKFYYFLAKKGVLKYCSPEDFDNREYTSISGRVNKIIEAPFPDLDLPEAKVQNRNEHDMTPELQSLLLEVAFEKVNQIALGVALEMFGGLRMSEVLRCRYSSIRTFGNYGEQGMLIVLKDNDEGTRPDLKNNGAKGYVKRPRIQEVSAPLGLLAELIKLHRKRYKAKNRSDAIFINAEGNAMSYESYIYYFRKLKKEFINVLKKSDNPILNAQGLVLDSSKWLTHIGRGIFSNNLIETEDNPVIAQIKRGDRSPDSIAVYIGNSKRIGTKFSENTEKTYMNLINKIKG